MTELTFLIDLLLDHELQLVTKKAVAVRIREVEKLLLVDRVFVRSDAPSPPVAEVAPPPPPLPAPAIVSRQAPSTQAAMARHAAADANLPPPPPPPPPLPPPPPVAIIAQTPQALAAMASRNEAINASMKGVIDKERGRPRKF